VFLGRGQQALESSSEVRRFRDVRLGRVVTTQQEDRWLGGNGGEDLVVAACVELKPVEEHKGILADEGRP
jgi:hypothetical protein